MSRTRTTLTAGALAAALVLPAGFVASAEAAPLRPSKVSKTAVGLVDGTRLVQFPLANPRKARQVARVTGLTGGDTRLIGIDYRIQDKGLYGVGNQGGVYKFGNRGKVRLVNRLTVALQGNEFGVDFNPAADRLRVISNTGQNLRHDVNAGGATIADTPLTYPGPNGATPGTGVTAAAYTNNDLLTGTGTALLDIDTTLDQLAVQSPANAGTLALVGKLRVNAKADAGFDIDQANRGWAVIAKPGRYRLYSVNLGTGKATAKGIFPKRLQVSDIAVPQR